MSTKPLLDYQFKVKSYCTHFGESIKSMKEHYERVHEYYKNIDDYELRCQPQSKRDIPFWCEIVKRYTPKYVLELACGSGRIGINLLRNQENFYLHGIDIDKYMLEAYKDKLEHEPNNIKQRAFLHQGDMSDYNLEYKGKFDLILLPFNSLGHLLETKQQLDTFHRSYEHLAPDGRFIVDMHLPGSRLSDAAPLVYLNLEMFRTTYSHFFPDGHFMVDTQLPENYLGNAPPIVYINEVIEMPKEKCRLVIYSAQQYDRHTQVQHIMTIHERFFESGSSERYLTQLDSHAFFPCELQMLFQIAGFEIEAIYGDYTWVPFEQGSRQIIIGHKRDK